MKVVLCMAPTINGFIAKENDDESFVSEENWKRFCSTINKIGNMIIGRRTYDQIKKYDELHRFKKVKIMVMTNNTYLKSKKSNIVFTSQTPRKILDSLKKQGFKEIVVAGGGTINGLFMKKGLIDELYIDIQPAVLGSGIKLFGETDFQVRLKLINIRKLPKNEVLLHYRVLK